MIGDTKEIEVIDPIVSCRRFSLLELPDRVEIGFLGNAKDGTKLSGNIFLTLKEASALYFDLEHAIRCRA